MKPWWSALAARTLRTSILLCVLCSGVQVLAQTTFQRTYDPTSGSDYGQCVVQAPDGGFYVAGIGIVNDSVVVGSAAVLRTDALGDTIWYRGYTTPGSTDLSLEHLILSSNGTLVVTGVVGYPVKGSISDYDAYVAEIDTNGNMLWSNTVGGPFKQWGKQIRETPDGGFVCAGWDQEVAFANYGAYYLVRMNEVGDTLWTNTYANENESVAYAIAPVADSGWVMVGTTSPWSIDLLHVVRTDQVGDTLWTQTLQTIGHGQLRDVEVLPNGHIMIAGISFPGGGAARPVLIEMDENGNLLWFQNYVHSGAGFSEWCFSMCKTTTGYALLNMDSNYNAFWLTNVDQVGDTLWTKGFFGTVAYAYGVEQTSDGGFVMTGLAQGPGTQIVLIKTDTLGNVITSTHDLVLDPSVTALVFPNPTTESATFQFTTLHAGRFSLRLHDAQGRVVLSLLESEHRGPGQYAEEVDLSGLARGSYTLVLSNGDQAVSARVIKN